MTSLAGQCRCGLVHYENCGKIVTMVNCHCNLCRAMNGSAFSSYVVVMRGNLSVTGEENLRAYPVTQRSTKSFCGVCGTPLFNLNPSLYPGFAMLYFGTLADNAALLPGINTYCDDKLAWVDSIAQASSFGQGAPARS